MEIKSMHFKANVHAKLADVVLQGNLKNAKGKFVTRRAYAIKDLDDFEGTRDAAEAIRNKVIDNLDLWLERFEQKAVETGATVLWAKDGVEVCRLVTEIAGSTA
jgi:L-lactate dehydrogenase complex protein LldF